MNDYLDYLEHHGILGQKWYRRRYQNEDGSLTAAGRERYGVGAAKGKSSSEKIAKQRLKEKKKQEKIARKQAKKVNTEITDEDKKKKPNYSPNLKKPLSEYTNEELQEVITRLQLEANYTRLIPKEKEKTQSLGKKFFNDWIVSGKLTKMVSDNYGNIANIAKSSIDLKNKQDERAKNITKQTEEQAQKTNQQNNSKSDKKNKKNSKSNNNAERVNATFYNGPEPEFKSKAGTVYWSTPGSNSSNDSYNPYSTYNSTSQRKKKKQNYSLLGLPAYRWYS